MKLTRAEAEGSAQVETMQPRLIKGFQASYVPAPWTGKNTSGLKVFGKHILVRMDECSANSAGGVVLPDEMIDRMTSASVTGVIYAVGPSAFAHYDDGTRWTSEKPKPGDRICIAKFSGEQQLGRDGGFYRAMDYGCVIAGEMTADDLAAEGIDVEAEG